jgi:L-fuconolactonase
MHEIIDTHIHSWNFDKARYEWLENDNSILNRNYEIEELETARVKAGIAGGVLVQAANNLEDTGWMLEVASRTSWLQGVVGWLPLTDPAATEKLLTEKYLRQPYFKGVRHLIHDEKDPRWLLQPTVIESLSLLAKHDIAYDVVGVLTQHIETAMEVANKVPGLRMIFDHLNQPPVGNDFGRWGELMREAAKHKNFFVKISGLGTASKKFNSWTEDDIRPCIEFVLQHFGEDRCCCGGDWPVSLLAGSYAGTWKAYKNVLSELLNEKSQEKVFSINAKLFYKLKIEH